MAHLVWKEVYFSFPKFLDSPWFLWFVSHDPANWKEKYPDFAQNGSYLQLCSEL